MTDDQAETWEPGKPGMDGLGPRACPVCGSVGAGRFMRQHLSEQHIDDMLATITDLRRELAEVRR